MLSSGANVIIWDEMLSSGMKCYHLELMLSSGPKCYHLGLNVIIWDAMLSSGANVIIWDKMLSCGGNVVMLSYGANVIIWCYHVMLSSGMITRLFFIFPGNFTHSSEVPSTEKKKRIQRKIIFRYNLITLKKENKPLLSCCGDLFLLAVHFQTL